MRGNFELWTLQVDAEAYVGMSMTVGQDTIFHQYIAWPQSVWFPDNTQQKNRLRLLCSNSLDCKGFLWVLQQLQLIAFSEPPTVP